MAFSLTEKTVRGISLSLRTDEAIPLIEDIILFAPELEMGIDYPLDERRRAIAGELRGIWQLGKTQFRTALYYPSFNFSAGMAEGQTLDAGAVLKHISPGIDLAEWHLTFTRMEVYGNFKNKSFSAEIAVDENSKWEFSIAGRLFGFQIKGMLMAYDNQRVSYAMDGSLVVAGVDVLLSAQYKRTVIRPSSGKAAAAGGGWKFEGSSDEGRKLKVAEVITWIGEQFGRTPQLPEAIEGFTVDRLKLSFDSEKQDFFFTCEGEVTLPGQKIAVGGVITIDIKHQDKSYTKLFGGSLTIDGMEFHLMYESSDGAGGHSQAFVAAFHDADGHTIKIDELVKRFFEDVKVNTGLEVSLKDALLAYQKTGASGKFLFGLDIEGGLNLSELNLPNLPLIGQPFPAGQTLKLALQVLAAGSNTFTVDDIDALNRLNGKGINLPQEQIQGLKLAALLRVGQETKRLSLPIGLSDEGKGLVEDKTAVAAAATNEQRDNVPPANGTQWIKIQKTFGPIHVERVGIGYQSGNIALLLDSALTVAGLTLSLDGLGAEFALKDLAAKEFKPTFHLNGLGIDYRNGPIEIGGSFLEQKGTLTVGDKKVDYTSYAGLAVIRTAKLTLSAIGSYSQLNDRDPSLFIYAVANYPLGGPAFFYVTGFAAGFGYNRALTLPPIEAVATFPLVAEAVKDGGPARLPAGQKEQQKTLTDKLQQLEQYLPPSVGDIFVAAGIKFTSFKQIDSFALLVVKFGRRFEIDLLGLSTLTAPPPEAGKSVTPVAEAQLALKASFVPDEGFLGVRAQLTSNSYILSKDCHLSGGFAFYTWFEPHRQAGDFVLTLGGYHPKFIVPDHYPRVPRLALNWQVSAELHVKADAYFALTSSCIMAGAHLEATWHSGALRAWFNAGADFILAWKPYHYDLAIYVGMGVSYTFEFAGTRTVTADLGADLHLWGPEFSGTATIHWSIISFTVNFGQGAPQELEPIDWNTFKTSFLPGAGQICSVAVQGGLIRHLKAEEKQPERWIVNPKEMVLAINSVVPLNEVKALAEHMQLAETDVEGAKHMAIAPVGIESNLSASLFSVDHFVDLSGFVAKLRTLQDPISGYLWNQFSASTQQVLTSVTSTPEQQKSALVQALNDILSKGVSIWENERFARVTLSPETLALKSQNPRDLIRLNRLLLEDAYPLEIAKSPTLKSPNLASSCSISITRDDGQPLEKDIFEVRPIWKPMPAGLWGKPNLTDDRKHLRPPSLNGAQLVENMLTGFEVSPIEKQQAHARQIDREELQYTTKSIGDAYGWRDFQLSASRGQEAWKAARTAVGRREKREQLLKALGLVNPVIDFGEPVDQGVLLAA